MHHDYYILFARVHLCYWNSSVAPLHVVVSRFILIPTCASITHGPFSVSFLYTLVTSLFFIHPEIVSRPARSHLFKSVHFLHFLHSGSSGLYSGAPLPFSLTMLCAPRFQDCYPRCSSAKFPASSLLGLNPPTGSLKAPSHDPHFPFPCRFSPVAIHLP